MTKDAARNNNATTVESGKSDNLGRQMMFAAAMGDQRRRNMSDTRIKEEFSNRLKDISHATSNLASTTKHQIGVTVEEVIGNQQSSGKRKDGDSGCG